jgi:hypothetical protein
LELGVHRLGGIILKQAAATGRGRVAALLLLLLLLLASFLFLFVIIIVITPLVTTIGSRGVFLQGAGAWGGGSRAGRAARWV